MAELSPHEVRDLVGDLMVRRDEPYTWVTGEVELVTRSEGRIRGELKSVDAQSLVVGTSSGDRRCRFQDVVNVIVQMSSPGPE